MVTPATPQYVVDIDVRLNGAKYLALVVEDGGNGLSCDWADWIEPRLVGPRGELKLTDLKWKSATADWGQVRVNQNAGGGALRVQGRPIAYGIGTHAHSMIEFDIPEGYDRFVAKGGLDNGGADQPGDQTSVKFLVYTQQSAKRPAPGEERSPDIAIEKLDVHPELQATLFAAEPMMLSPSNVDIDHRGRVWVCEIVNYRGHNGERTEGDRILILEDSDSDGQADTSKVFYQGRDIDSPHGVCVLGNRVIVSAGSQVLCLTDEDGDDRADKKEVWFSGISGVQHDHGIHAFVFGPDGKLYFNFGNEGKQLLDTAGKPVVDMDGKVVSEASRPYQQGMIFRCNLDRSGFETLAWNFRNNWMVTVDSFGAIWQSDNDDDGNRGVRINYVMPFGNYGYRDEMTSAGWQTPRIGMSSDTAQKHWHQEDPGVVPNLLHTGAGSPTGITIYEGDSLPAFLRGQIVHCDAGPSITRAYPVTEYGAGFRAETVNLLHGARDPWFRPSDVKVAPDGSLIVADWYDPGVGGHAMGDVQRGRLFRLTTKGTDTSYRIPKFDFQTPRGAVAALMNPNYAVRYLAWLSLQAMGESALPELKQMTQSDNPVFRARALWFLGNSTGNAEATVKVASADKDSRIRCLAIRLAKQQSSVDALAVVAHLVNDPSAQVRRECATALRHVHDARVPKLWSKLASLHDGKDRWYLEALGIGADQQWDVCLSAWLQAFPAQRNTPAGRDIIWRSRSTETPELLRAILLDAELPIEEAPRYLRALDFLEVSYRDPAVNQLALAANPADPKGQMILSESLARLSPSWLESHSDQRVQFDNLIGKVNDLQSRIGLISRFKLTDRYAEVLQLAIQQPDAPEGIDALKMLVAAGQNELLQKVFDDDSDNAAEVRQKLLRAFKNSADNRGVPILVAQLSNANFTSEQRRDVVDALAHIRSGAEYLVQEAEQQRLATDQLQAAAASLQRVPWNDLRDRAAKAFPMTPAKDNKPLPSLKTLSERQGDPQNGATVFRGAGTCAKCHVVRQEGKAIGPELSEIGKKLSREAMFESILYPSAGISHSFETYSLELKDGNVLTGILTSQADETVEIKNNEGVVQRIARADIENLVKQSISIMPADLHQNLTEQELVDLVEYLSTLK